MATSGDKVRVHNPVGYPPAITQLPMARRRGSLEGRTVYLVDCRFDDSDVFLKQMQVWFQENMPSVNAVFVQKSGVYTEDDPRLFDEIKAKGGVAVVGVGH